MHRVEVGGGEGWWKEQAKPVNNKVDKFGFKFYLQILVGIGLKVIISFFFFLPTFLISYTPQRIWSLTTRSVAHVKEAADSCTWTSCSPLSKKEVLFLLSGDLWEAN